MTTYGTMVDRIEDEIADTSGNLETQIQRAIKSAIAHYQRRRFYFNEKVATFSTVAAQQWYSSSDLSDIPNIVEIDRMAITIGSTNYPLNARSQQWIEDMYVGTSDTGDLTDYAYYRQQIRLYPIPTAVRTITLSYVYQPSALSASTDSNVWTTDAEELIRQRAKAVLKVDVLNDDRAAAEAVARTASRLPGLSALEGAAFEALVDETTRRVVTGRIRPGGF